MQPEYAVDRAYLRRANELRVRDRHGMQRPFEILAPECEELLKHRKLRPDVVLLPNVGLQQPWVIRATVEDPCGGEPITLELAAKILRNHRCPSIPGEHQFFCVGDSLQA